MTASRKSPRPAKKKPAGAKPKTKPKPKAKPKTKKKAPAKAAPKKGRFLRLAGLLAGAVLTALVLTWVFMPGAPPEPTPSAKTPVAKHSPSNATKHASPRHRAAAHASKASITYEEPSMPPVASDRHQRLNEALFEALYQVGANQEQIVSRLAHNNGSAWWVHSVNLAKGQDGQAMAANLGRDLAKFSGVKVVSGHAGRISTLTVSLGGHKEHVIWLVPPTAKSEPPQPPVPLPAHKPGKSKPLAAIVIDDMGYQLKPARKLMALGLPLTLSILPHGPHSKEIAKEAKAKGLEVFLHLPMEPRSYPRIDPGPGALLVSMPQDKLRQLVRDDLAQVPGAIGVNNHMGSRFTESSAKLKPVFEELAKRGLFFLDSYTSPKSQAKKAARETGLPLVRRDVFLDHDVSEKAITLQIERMLFLAKRKKTVIAIGHPHPETIAALKSYAPRLRKVLALVPVSRVLAARTGAQKAGRAAAN